MSLTKNQAQQKLGAVEEAIRTLKQSIELDPANNMVMFKLAEIYVNEPRSADDLRVRFSQSYGARNATVLALPVLPLPTVLWLTLSCG